MDKRQFSERDICTKFIAPALEQAGWDIAKGPGSQGRKAFPEGVFITSTRLWFGGNEPTRNTPQQ